MLTDLRYALRLLIKSPGFTCAAVLTLALGIGANTAMFSAVQSVLLRGLPYHRPNQLVILWESNSDIKGFIGKRLPVSLRSYFRWKQDAQSFEDIALYSTGSVNIAGMEKPEHVQRGLAASNLFPLLGVTPEVGRNFTSEETQGEGHRVAMLSHALFERRFGHDRAALGRTISIDEVNYEIIGVLPASFRLPALWQGNDQTDAQVWTPLNMVSTQPTEALSREEDYALARLKPGVKLEQAASEMATIEKRLENEDPKRYRHMATNVVPLPTEDMDPELRLSLLVLQFAVGFVLLIACANVANLLLTRAAGREKEIAVRVALGATRGHIIRQVLMESLVFSAIGGAVGLAFAVWGVRAVAAVAPKDIHRLHDLQISPVVLAFTAGVVVIAAIIFGLAPAFHASAQSLHASMSKGGRSGRAGLSKNLRNALAVGEIALALVPLAGAGLMIRTLRYLSGLEPGFNPQHAITAHISLPDVSYGKPEQQHAFINQLLERVQNLPGVEAAAIAGGLPQQSISISGYHLPGEEGGGHDRVTDYERVSEDYFRAMGTPIVRGRAFTREEADNRSNVAIVNTAFAKATWPGEDPLGKTFFLHHNGPKSAALQVIGTTADTHQFGPTETVRPEVYIADRSQPFFVLITRTHGDPTALTPAITDQLHQLDPNLPLYEVMPLTDLLKAGVEGQRFTMVLLSAFAALALALAVIGLYGVLSYAVAQRTREIGIRMALGASAKEVLGMVMRQGAVAVFVGIAIGLAGSLALTQAMAGMLYGTKAYDIPTFVAVCLLVAAVAMAATWVPARRAAKVDPMIALRYE